mmetsp:Transcript_18108/g.39609  ORF Transcript_18108/g.39609 Transcript_18108/m.39609 type:complete len:220 (-) Transcript_18108:273-932(-)
MILLSTTVPHLTNIAFKASASFTSTGSPPTYSLTWLRPLGRLSSGGFTGSFSGATVAVLTVNPRPANSAPASPFMAAAATVASGKETKAKPLCFCTFFFFLSSHGTSTSQSVLKGLHSSPMASFAWCASSSHEMLPTYKRVGSALFVISASAVLAAISCDVFSSAPLTASSVGAAAQTKKLAPLPPFDRLDEKRNVPRVEELCKAGASACASRKGRLCW